VNDLTSEKPTENSVLLTWSAPEEDAAIEGYSVYRNEMLLTEELILNTSYLDENLLFGNYEYYVLTYYTNGCLSNPSNNVEETVEELGINQVSKLESIVLYPNPTTGELSVFSYQFSVEEIQIFDVYGRDIVSLKSLMSFETTINIAHLPAGIYFVKISTEAGVAMRKVVKQ